MSLTFDATRLQNALSKIRKKDPARIAITQIRDRASPYNFDGPGSSDDFTIYVSCGVGGDGREGLKSVPATRVPADNTLIKYPEKFRSSLLVIPVRQFRSMIDSFSKCKRESIIMRYHVNMHNYARRKRSKKSSWICNYYRRTSQSGRIYEKFGEVPDEDNKQPLHCSNSSIH